MAVSKHGSVARDVSVPGNVKEDDGVDTVLLQLGSDVLAVALQGHEVSQPLPLAPQQILATHLAVEHLVP